MARNLTAALISFLALLWAAAFVWSAIHQAHALLNPLENVGFGPHVMPWSGVIFFFSRGIAGVVIAILLSRVLKREPFSLLALFVSLLTVNAFYLHELWKFVPDARYLNISVFAALSPVFLADFLVHKLGLLLCIFTATGGIRKRVTGA